MGDSTRGNEARLVLYNRLPVRRFKGIHMTEFEKAMARLAGNPTKMDIEIARMHFLPVGIMLEATDLAYSKLNSVEIKQDKSVNQDEVELLLNAFNQTFNPDGQTDFVPSKSYDFAKQVFNVVMVPKQANASLWQEIHAKQATELGNGLLIERPGPMSSGLLGVNCTSFMHSLLRALAIFDPKEL